MVATADQKRRVCSDVLLFAKKVEGCQLNVRIEVKVSDYGPFGAPPLERDLGNVEFANKAERSFMKKPKGDQKYCRIPICVTKRICKKMKEVLLTRTEILGNSYVKND